MLRASQGCGKDYVRTYETAKSGTNIGCHFDEVCKPLRGSSFPYSACSIIRG